MNNSRSKLKYMVYEPLYIKRRTKMKKAISILFVSLFLIMGTFYYIQAAEQPLCKDCGSELACLEGRDADYGGYMDCELDWDRTRLTCKVSGGYCGNW